jgi:hypothetical protein
MLRFRPTRRRLPPSFSLSFSGVQSIVTAKIGLRHLSPLLFVAIRLAACALVLMALPRDLGIIISHSRLLPNAYVACSIADQYN